ncbi:MAG: hypothetical protein AB1512_31460 [Thermodesulfobacteriota bacterium]
MERIETLPTDTFLQEDPFGMIRPQDFESLGIDPEDVPAGTFAARKHPPKLLSRFGGNAYGFGFFEVYDRLKPNDLKLLQSLSLRDPEKAGRDYREINRIYKNLGLLIRFSRHGKPFYLIPEHLASNSLSMIKNKSDEITKIVDFHRRKYLKESHRIGLLTHGDDQVVNELTVRFKEHQFILLDSHEKLRLPKSDLDLVILTRDIYETVLMQNFTPGSGGIPSKRELESYASYLLGKVHRLLKPGGEIFIIAHRLPLQENRWVEMTFRTEQEERNFLLFSHIFRTQKRYRPQDGPVEVHLFDLQKYLNHPYVEKEVIDRLLQGKQSREMSIREIQDLPYLDFPLRERFAYDQEKVWSRVLSVFFSQIFLKPLLPASVREDWGRRFSTGAHVPDYMLIYLGQKRQPATALEDLKRDVVESRLSGCPLELLADDRDSFEYLIATLNVLRRIKTGDCPGMPRLYMDRLREPIENKQRRYAALNDVLKLMPALGRLERIQSSLNPGGMDGRKTRVVRHLETLSLHGFAYGELREIFLIVAGHTPLERILCGKTNEKALKPVSDFARGCEPQTALNFLRYCRLMSVAETAASKGEDLNPEELAELFELYARLVRVVTSRETDWDRLQEERIAATGGIRSEAVRKIVKMMSQFQFLSVWPELSRMGEMEKETLADYDEEKLHQIDRILRLVHTIERFERAYFREDPIKASAFYRKFLNMEFHGTVHLFGRLQSELAFVLLWITVNVVRGTIVNFNPLFAGVEPAAVDGLLRKLEEGVAAINTRYLSLDALETFAEHLYADESSFILGTGFQLRVNRETQAIEFVYMDMEEVLQNLGALCERFRGSRVSEIPEADLHDLESLFAHLEGFYQSHLRLISHEDPDLKMPERQRAWFRRARDLREVLRSNFMEVLFRPESIYTELEFLYRFCPTLLEFLLPEFTALEETSRLEQGGRTDSSIEHILLSTKKLQALVEGNRAQFQDVKLLHRLAQREFGPMTAGIVGLNEGQIETLERLIQGLKKNRPLFDALVKSFVLRCIGMIPSLREKYRDEIHPADSAQAGALILEKERVSERYRMDVAAFRYLVPLIQYHNLIYHMTKGEFSFYAMEDVINLKDPELFDAIFVSSFIMFYATGEEMVLEDLATRLFRFRTLCHRIMAGETNPEDHLGEVFVSKGRLFKALEAYRREGRREAIPSASYFESFPWQESERGSDAEAGKMIYALERVFRLRGIRYVEFADLAHYIVKIPLPYIYRKRRYYGIGYATFEKELFEALRLYNSLNQLPEAARHFLLQRLITDEVRIFGLEKVTTFLNYENQIKLLLIALLGAEPMISAGRPVSLDYLAMAADIHKRYEAVNAFLNSLPVERIWEERHGKSPFFEAETGIVFRRMEPRNVLSIHFEDPINFSQKLSFMKSIPEADRLKNYYRYTLRSLRETPFHTEDYELELERACETRLREITDLMIEQVQEQIRQGKEFREIHRLVYDLIGQSLEIGFTEEQKHRLSDVYEMRKENLKKEKLDEISSFLEGIRTIHELKAYWESIKSYLSTHRSFLGKEYETLVARRFDQTMMRLEGR